MALRAKAIPVNPNSPRQNVVRTSLAYLISYWVEVLTPAQRQTWHDYSFNVLRTNVLGHTIAIGGMQHWVRSNLPRLHARLSLVTTAPTNFTLGSFTAITANTVDSIAQRLIFSFDNTDDWAGVSGSAMLIYIARPQNQSVATQKRNFRFAGAILGNTFIRPTSPHSVALPFLFSIAQKCFFRVVVTRLDGRYTISQPAEADVT